LDAVSAVIFSQREKQRAGPRCRTRGGGRVSPRVVLVRRGRSGNLPARQNRGKSGIDTGNSGAGSILRNTRNGLLGENDHSVADSNEPRHLKQRNN